MSSQLLTSSLAALMALVAAASIPAEAAQVRCQIPFSFTVHGTTLPPGMYGVSTDGARGVLAIRGNLGFALAMVNDIQSGDDTEAKLVFHKYDDQYYLQEVWLGGRYGRELRRNRPKSELDQDDGSRSRGRDVRTRRHHGPVRVSEAALDGRSRVRPRFPPEPGGEQPTAKVGASADLGEEAALARQVANRVVFMDAGEIVEVNAPDAFVDSPRHPRTQAFLSQILR